MTLVLNFVRIYLDIKSDGLFLFRFIYNGRVEAGGRAALMVGRLFAHI